MEYNIAKRVNDLIVEVTGVPLLPIQDARIMKNEESPYDEDYIQHVIGRNEVAIVEHLIMSRWSSRPKKKLLRSVKLMYKYIDYDKLIKTNNGIKWENLHGKKRKIAKYKIKKLRREIRKKYDTYNKYVGRDDVLYFHTIVDTNQYNELRHSQSYIEDIPDWYDPRYKDMYFKADSDMLSDLLNDKEFMKVFDLMYQQDCPCFTYY